MLRNTLTILSLMLCASCADSVHLELPPVSLTTCEDAPLAPDLPPIDWSSVDMARSIVEARDAAMLAFGLDIHSAWGDCKSKVEGLRVWRETAGD